MTRVLLQVHRVAVTNPTGVHRYVTELTRALRAGAAPGDAVELWAGREPAGAESGADATWPWPRRPLHLAWTVAGRPRADRFAPHVDLMHSLTPAVALPTRRPLVVTVHDLLPLTHPQWYAAGPRRGVARALRHAARHAARIVTPSAAVADAVRSRLGVDARRLVVVPEGVDAGWAAVPEPAAVAAECARWSVQPGRYVVAVGELSPRKNLDLLIRAVAASPDALPLLLVGGDGAAAAQLRDLPRRHAVADRVRFTGRVDDDRLRLLVHGARALVHPSSYEGFGLPPLEAMAAGTAVVAAGSGAVPEVVGGAGLLLDPTDEAGWAAALEQVATDDEWVLAAQRRGRARAAQFSWEEAARRTWAVYAAVLAEVAAC